MFDNERKNPSRGAPFCRNQGLGVAGSSRNILAVLRNCRQTVQDLKATPTIAFLGCIALLPAVWLVVVLDEWLGASQSVAFEACLILLGIFAGAVVVFAGWPKTLLAVPGLFILFLLVLPFLDLSPVKPAVRAVREIHPGMTESEVRAVFDRHFPEPGRFKRPAIGTLHNDRLAFVLDPNDGRYNAAVVWVSFSHGTSVAAGFDPD